MQGFENRFGAGAGVSSQNISDIGGRARNDQIDRRGPTAGSAEIYHRSKVVEGLNARIVDLAGNRGRQQRDKIGWLIEARPEYWPWAAEQLPIKAEGNPEFTGERVVIGTRCPIGGINRAAAFVDSVTPSNAVEMSVAGKFG